MAPGNGTGDTGTLLYDRTALLLLASMLIWQSTYSVYMQCICWQSTAGHALPAGMPCCNLVCAAWLGQEPGCNATDLALLLAKFTELAIEPQTDGLRVCCFNKSKHLGQWCEAGQLMSFQSGCGTLNMLATLAPLAQLKAIVLDFEDAYELSEPEHLLRPESWLLPSSVTKLVLCNLDRCVPAVALPENVPVVHTPTM